jgi:MSHA biogenesis protein MshP
MIPRIGKQKGFSAIIAVVLIVLFALLGTYMATLSNISSFNTTQSLGSMQSWFAARSGIEWAVYRVINDGNCTTVSAASPLSLSGGSTNGFSVTLTCSVVDDDGLSDGIREAGGSPYNVYNITASASKGSLGGITYLSKNINISVTDAP